MSVIASLALLIVTFKWVAVCLLVICFLRDAIRMIIIERVVGSFLLSVFCFFGEAKGNIIQTSRFLLAHCTFIVSGVR
jgi:hypothetical protein